MAGFDLRKLLEDSLVAVNPFGVGTVIQGQRKLDQMKSKAPPASTASPRLSATQKNNIAKTEQAAKNTRAQVFNPFAIGQDIVNAGVNAGKTVVSGVQQGIGNVADIATQGGAVLGSIGAQTNPFKNDAQKRQQELQQYNANQKVRNQIKGLKTVTGESLNPNIDYQPTGDLGRDIANIAGRSLQTGLDATMFFNPVNLAARGAAGTATSQLLRDSAKQAVAYGSAQGLATGGQTYGDTGDLGQAVLQGATAGAVSGIAQGGLNTLGGLAGVAGRSTKPALQATTKLVQDNTPTAIARKTVAQDPRVLGFDDQYATLQQQFDTLSPTSPQRSAVSRAMAENRQQRLATSKGLERDVLQGGYARIPGKETEISAIGEPINTSSELIQPSVELPVVQQKTRFASQTAPNSGNLSPELANTVRENAASYSKTTNRESVDKSIDFLSNRTEDEAIEDVLTRLSQKNIDRQSVTDAIATASALDARGGARNLELAQNIYDRLSEQLTKAGQTVQAASIISRRTPEGMAYNALRELQKADVPVTPDIRQAIVTKTQEIGKLKLGSEARERATAELQKEVNKLIPTELIDKLVGTWKAGLLTGIRTTTGGSLSNALFRGLREISRPGAVATDMIASLFTGKRSTALTARGAWGGTTEGLKKAGKYLKSGVDERSFSADGKYIDREINFKNKPLKTYVNGVFRVMGAADRPFYYSQFRNSLAEAGIVEAKNLKLKGKAFDDYVENSLKNPTDEAAQFATNVAEQAVLANDTLLSNVANKLREAVSKQENGAVRFVGKGALGVLAPFTKVPSAFLSRVVDFTPIGAVKEAVTQMATGKLSQQKLVQAISEAGTGTGLIYLGAELANNDLLTGNYPNDPKEQARWKTEGITPNSVKVGDTYYSLNYAGPVGALFGIGKSINDTAKEGGDVASSLTAGASQLASGTLEQSFLSGVSGALDAVQDPKRYAENFVRSQAGSVVPTLLNDVGNVTDETQRQANTPFEAIQSRIPGARAGLNAKLDSFGNEIEQANPNVLGRLVDPLRPSKRRETPVTNELDRLAKVGESIFPTNDKTLEAGGKTIKLDGNQQNDYNSTVGKETDFIWGNILNNEQYQGLTDADKKKTLENSAADINAVTKKAYLYSIGEEEAADAIKLTKRQEKYVAGTIDPTQWIPKDTSVASTPTSKQQLATDLKAAKARDKARTSSSKKSKANKGKYNYAKRLESNVSTAQATDKALRNLVYGSKITAKKAKA